MDAHKETLHTLLERMKQRYASQNSSKNISTHDCRLEDLLFMRKKIMTLIALPDQENEGAGIPILLKLVPIALKIIALEQDIESPNLPVAEGEEPTDISESDRKILAHYVERQAGASVSQKP